MIVTIFLLVYAGMLLGNIPGLAVDRTGIALLAAIALVLFGHLDQQQLVDAINWPTIAMLFGLMIVSAQFYFSGFYTLIMKRIGKLKISPNIFLFCVIALSGLLSAILINDIICLALVPILITICSERMWNPIPFLIGLACSANIGSAITLIGNPQNILIGESITISFSTYFLQAIVPCVLSLIWTWIVLIILWRKQWSQEHLMPITQQSAMPSDTWHILKGIGILTILIVLFVVTPIPRFQLVLLAAGLLLLSRKMASEKMLGFVDWQLLVLFFGLFITNKAFLDSETAQNLIASIKASSLDFTQGPTLFASSFLLTNIISNVPATMVLLPFISTPQQGTFLALSSTLAGNFFLIGSLANILVATKARTLGVQLRWKTHLKAGVPIGLGSVILSYVWLVLYR